MMHETPAKSTVPTGFWPQISHQLDRIRTTHPSTFDEVRAILLDPAYTEIVAEMNRNGARSFDADSAFFAGSGGDKTLAEALRAAGWVKVIWRAPYHYAMQHIITAELLTYTEGDVQRGRQIARN
ncbi:hypothetical protein [Streptomyces sp. NPDC052042]|uniref:hypothetical protein n=1 Tax=Streptomyces sp. NPDC052042 TaxID=3365683 RepID=UPI0037D02D36